MKKKFSIFFFIFVLFLNKISYLQASIFHDEIANKYDEIFSEKILKSEDIINYKKIFKNQENCKWKIANKYILLINNDILM